MTTIQLSQVPAISIVSYRHIHIANDLPAKPTYPVSIGLIVPAYNAVRTIREILHRVYQALDGIVQENPRIELYTHEKNRGKGAAIRTGLEFIFTDLVIIQDADLEYDPNDIPLLVEPLLAGEADIIFGSGVLPLPGGKPRPRRNIYGWGVWVLDCLIHARCGYRLTDHATCYKLLRTCDLKSMNLRSDGFEFCVEVVKCASERCFLIVERAVNFKGRQTNDGKKIAAVDFFNILLSY